MSTHPILINNLNFAKSQSVISGRLQVADLARTKEWVDSLSVHNSSADAHLGYIDYELQGVVDGTALLKISMKLDVYLVATCQRCLEAFDLKLKLNYLYLITALSEEAILMADNGDHDDVDLLTIDQAMDVIALIEDEVISALPFSPVHSQACAPSKIEFGNQPSPFAGLKELLKK
jgi:uncharacterized protein